jgi:hypothetical protein
MDESVFETAYSHIKLCVSSSIVQHTMYHEYNNDINNKNEYSHSEILVDSMDRRSS